MRRGGKVTSYDFPVIRCRYSDPDRRSKFIQKRKTSIMHVAAKVRIDSVLTFAHSDDRHITFRPVYSSDPKSPNYSWSKATPSGQIQLTVSNPEAFKDAMEGDEYYITFKKSV